MMKLSILLLAVLLGAAAILGCAHSTPSAYSPKNATEKTVVAYAKTKAPDLVVVDIKSPQLPPEQMNTMFAATGIPYNVTLASASDATMQTTLMVLINPKTLQPIDQPNVTIPPLAKVIPKTK